MSHIGGPSIHLTVDVLVQLVLVLVVDLVGQRGHVECQAGGVGVLRLVSCGAVAFSSVVIRYQCCWFFRGIAIDCCVGVVGFSVCG